MNEEKICMENNLKEKKDRILKSMMLYSGADFWKNYMVAYFGEDLISKRQNFAQETWIPSKDQEIHLEIYESQNSKLPVIIFSHGIAGYARLMLPFVMPLFELGYTVVAPDLQGYGYNKGIKGRFTFQDHVQNLKDVVQFAKHHFGREIIICGASMGGPLAYAAGCNNEDVDGIVCWCLWELNDPDYIKYQTKMGRSFGIIKPFLKLIARLFGFLRVKTNYIVPYDTLSKADSFMGDLVLKDPQAGRKITLKGAISLVSDCTPEISYEQLSKPILVVHPEEDRMVSMKYSEKVFEKLGTRRKEFLMIKNCEHFPLDKVHYEEFTSHFHQLVQNGFFK